MARHLQPLTGDVVASLPGPCATCVAWELGAACPQERTTSAVVPGHTDAGPGGTPGSWAPSDRGVRKQAWVSAQVQDGTPPGRVLLEGDGTLGGYALYAPAPAFARRRPPVPATDPTAILLATVWVPPERRGHGYGRLLLQAAIKDALQAGAPAVEAYGDRRWVERSCVLPATWLLHEGFEVHREHPRNPLLRLDVRRTARWADSLEHALEELVGAFPRRVPSPLPEGVRARPRGIAEPQRTDRHRSGPADRRPSEP